jgi:hypothetical protein
MATTCPIGFDAQRLRDAINEAYSLRATDPALVSLQYWRDYAVNQLRYEREEFARSRTAAARFAGVGNPHRVAAIEPGEQSLTSVPERHLTCDRRPTRGESAERSASIRRR